MSSSRLVSFHSRNYWIHIFVALAPLHFSLAHYKSLVCCPQYLVFQTDCVFEASISINPASKWFFIIANCLVMQLILSCTFCFPMWERVQMSQLTLFEKRVLRGLLFYWLPFRFYHLSRGHKMDCRLLTVELRTWL